MSDEPDFSDFEDWLIDGPAGVWPNQDKPELLSPKQKEVAKNNATLLQDREKWIATSKRFLAELNKFKGATERKSCCDKFEIRFDHHKFKTTNGTFDLKKLIFHCSVNFQGATFEDSNVDFSDTTFCGEFNCFDLANFGKGMVSFASSNFVGRLISFRGAKFENVNFANARFDAEWTTFDRASIGSGMTLFIQAKFVGEYVSFNGTNFGNGITNFRESHFSNGTVSFDGAMFGRERCTFENSKFDNRELSFRNCAFGTMETSFENMEVLGNLFVESNFPGPVNLTRLTVGGTAQFSGSKFDHVPNFRDAKFDRPPEIAKMIVPKPKLSKHRFLSFGVCTDVSAVEKYRKLKSMALSANDHEKDGEFFAYEMMAKRGTETKGFLSLLFNSIYWHLSNYGQSFLLPIGWLLSSFAVFSSIYAGLILPNLCSWSNVLYTLELSFKNSIPLLNSLFRFSASPDGYKTGFQKMIDALPDADAHVDLLIYLGVAQQLISGILLFFILLGLRNRFRLK